MNSTRLGFVSAGLLLLDLLALNAGGQVFQTPRRGSTLTASAAAEQDTSSSDSGTAPSLQPIPSDSRRLPPPTTTNWPETFAAPGEVMMTDPGMVGYDPYLGYGADCCPESCYQPEWGVFLELLFLRPGNTEVTYAVEQTGCNPATSSPTGPVGDLSPSINGGFRLGFDYEYSPDTAAGLTYSWFESSTSESIAAAAGTVLASQVTYPNQPACGDSSLSASAGQTVRFQLLDLDYRRGICGTCNNEVYLLGGLRIGRLDQDFTAQQNTGVATGLTQVGTNLRTEAIGLRLGIGGERQNPRYGLLLYARGAGSLLGGRSKADFVQTSQFGGAVPISLARDDYRLFPVLEAEFGVGWVSRSQRWRLLGGYQANAWMNTLTTSEFIRGVNTGIYDSLGDTLTFDGLALRLEYRR